MSFNGRTKAAGELSDQDVKAAQTAFEQFLMSSPYLNNSAAQMGNSNNDQPVRLKNTFIEVEESDNFVSQLGFRSSTAPADISDEIFQLARTITRDLPLMATLAAGLDTSSYDFATSSPTTSNQNQQRSFVVTPTVAAGPHVIPDDPDMSIEGNYTTVMLRNIPNKYTQSALLQALDDKDFKGKYNFFYLPVDYRTSASMGYAFINFIDHAAALKFQAAFKGYQLPAKSTKICETSWARVQGLKANVEHYRNSPVNDIPDPEYRPLLFHNGVEVAFPRPDAIARRTSGRRRYSPGAPEIAYTRTSTQSSSTPAGFADSDAPVKLFIGGLSAETRDDDLRDHFEQFGMVADATVVIDKKTGVSRGFGFCSFHEQTAGERVMAKRQHIINGQSVGVRFYQGRK